jgi:hypothetical protein
VIAAVERGKPQLLQPPEDPAHGRDGSRRLRTREAAVLGPGSGNVMGKRCKRLRSHEEAAAAP